MEAAQKNVTNVMPPGENPGLSPSALEKLAALPPREMRRAIHSAFGNAKVAGRSEVGPDDIQDPRARRQRIGF